MKMIRMMFSLALVTLLMHYPGGLRSDVDALTDAGRDWIGYFRSGDLDGLMNLYVDDAVVALHGQPALFGKPAIREYFADRLGKGDIEFELKYELQESHGSIAYIISQYWFTSEDRDSGTRYRDAGRSLLVYKRSGGRWKIAADLDQSTPDVGWPSPSGLE